MYFKHLLLIIFLFVFQLSLTAQDTYLSIPTPYVNGINVLTGMAEQPLSTQYSYEYEENGQNPKIKKITSAQHTIEFFYSPNSTEVIENCHKKSIYRYQDKQLITSLEHYINEFDSWKLYRKENFFWDLRINFPFLKTKFLSGRVLLDAEDRALICYYCEYNSKGKLSKETLYGNLSGICQIPLIIQANGRPIENGIESYSVTYEYALDGSDLLIKASEDNGLFTRYFYDSDSKHCIAKFRGNPTQILTRYFYEYDKEGCVNKTIVDDGQSYAKNDLSDVTCRKIMYMESSHQLFSYGQPSIIENKYYDLSAKREILLDKTVCTYASDGKLISQQLFDAAGNLIQPNTVESRPKEDTLQNSEIAVQDINNPLEGWSITTDGYGNETKCFYDAFGRLIEMQMPHVLDQYDQPYQPQIKQEYNICNQTSQVTDALGKLTSTTYTIRGKPAVISFPDGSTESFVYFLDGEIKEKISRNGTKSLVTRDDCGRIKSKQEFSASGTLLNEIFYSYVGTQIQSISDGHSFTLKYRYDGAGRQIECLHETANGVKHASCSYDAQGNADKIRSWHGANDQPFFEKNNTASVDQSESNDFHVSESMTSNNRGQFVKTVEIVDYEGIKKIHTYDALGRLENTCIFNSFGIKKAEQDFRYDANGRKLLERHFNFFEGEIVGTFVLGWEYDEGDRVCAIHEGLGTPLQKNTYYSYNSLGQLLQITKPDGTDLYYSYNDKGLLSHLQASNGSIAYQYEYDHLQRLVKVEDLLHDTFLFREFDAFNQLIAESDGFSQISYQYDLSGRCTKITLPDHSGIQYHYNKNQLFSVERISKDQSILYAHQYAYEKENDLLQESSLIKNLGKLFYQYDKSGQLSKISSSWWSEEYTPTGFDKYGRILTRSIKDPLGQVNFEYSYNDGQLTKSKDDQTQEHSYDSLYNRLSHNNQTWAVNEINQLMSTQDAQFTYDQNGNLTKKIKDQNFITYFYDALNRLVRLETQDGKAVEYRYDAFNRRIGEQTFLWDENDSQWQPENFSKFIFDGEKEIGKINEQNEVMELRVLGLSKGAEIGAAIAIELQGELYAPIHDHQGSVRCLIDAKTGKVAEFYRYQAFGEEEIYDGNCLPIKESKIGNPWHYFSKRVDKYSKLIFFGLRYYDSEIGRWTTPDPLFFGDTPNVYAFLKNDPLNHYDVHGLFSISKIWDSTKASIYNFYQSLKSNSTKFKKFVNEQMRLPESITASIDNVGRTLIGDCTRLLLGYSPVESHSDYYGEREVSDKVRITFINGILTNHNMLQENLDLISQSHGGIKVHYVFRGTRGWSYDLWKAALIKTCYYFGYRSEHAYLLAETWREMIDEMGGIDGGGVIIHYAHSLGGSVTDRARTLLTPEEQKMIRVFTIGSATLVNNRGFQNVVNIISANDGICSFIIEPIGHFKNYFNSNSNIRVYGSFTLTPYGLIPMWPIDHFLNGFTYKPIMWQLGQNFLNEFDTSA
jgi:RHS repeat-associated protein